MVDANTLHLWHLDETAAGFTSYADSPTVGAPISLESLGSAGNASTQVGVASYSPSFNNAFQGVASVNTGIYAKIPANGTGDNSSMTSFRNATTGAFTYEALVNFSDDPLTLPVAGFQIISADGETSSTDRAFQFVLNNLGAGVFRLEFENISGGEGAGSGLFSNNVAVSQNTWYHAAVTYNGTENTPNNLKLFWTEVNPVNNVANEVGSLMMVNDNLRAFGDFAVGAEARNAGGNTGQWNGMIDEVRISDIARSADQFVFVPEPSTPALAAFGLIALGYRGRPCRRKHFSPNIVP